MSQPLHSGKHPDADQINTFVEGAASVYQREEMLVHMADCAECRDLVFLLQSAAEPEPEPARRPEPVRRRWFLPLGLAGAALACGITALVYLDMHRPSAEPPAQTAMVNPAPQSAPQVASPPAPSQGAPFARNRVRPEAHGNPHPRVAPQGAAGGAVSAALAIDQPVPAPSAPSAAPTPVVDAGAQVSAKAVQPAARSEATNGTSAVALAGRNFGRLGGPGTAPALRIEHDRGPDDGSTEIAGRVTDMAGALIPGAEVALRDAAGATRQTKTGVDGRFSLAGVAPGHYTLNVTAPGFQSVQQAMNLQARDVASLETVLPVGAESEAVTVQAEQNSVQTQQAEISDSATTLANELPSRKPAAERVAKGKLVVSIDSAGKVFLSRNGGKSWKKVKPAWTGKAAELAVVGQAPEASGEIEAKHKSGAPGGVQVFQITTDNGAVWISDDGAHWRSR